MRLRQPRLFRIQSVTDSVDSRQEPGLLNILVLSVGLAAGATRVSPKKMPFTLGMNSSWSRIHWADQLNKIRVLLADDHPGFPQIAEHFLEPEFEVISKVVDGQALLDEAMKLKPDVVVTDISMPVLNGIEAADRLKESGSKSRVVFLTVHTDADFVRRCLSAGALGYVVKSRIATDLVPAIRQAMAGHIFISGGLVENTT